MTCNCSLYNRKKSYRFKSRFSTDGTCDGVAKLPRPRPAPHKRASRLAPNFMVLFY